MITRTILKRSNVLLSTPCTRRLLTIPAESYTSRHIGPRVPDIKSMLNTVGYESLDEFVKASMPSDVLVNRRLKIQPEEGFSEQDALLRLKELAKQNKVVKSLIGRGYYGTVTPSVITRSVLENPNWYTSYTPYQPEISQGRLESMFNFQTMICDLTGMEITNASLLDEATAAAEAMVLSFNHYRSKKPRFLVDKNVFNQTYDVMKTRALFLGIQLEQLDLTQLESIDKDVCGVLVSYPGADGSIQDLKPITALTKGADSLLVVASDLLALTVIKPPKDADIVIGNSQRFGVPLGFGGPHAGFFAAKEKFSRKIPGRIIGVSKDRLGQKAFRLALQTREQHIRREKATSNICTAQALLANISAMYAVYHGPEGLRDIATQVHLRTRAIASLIGSSLKNKTFFDTLTIKCQDSEKLRRVYLKNGFNIWVEDEHTISLSLDESITGAQFDTLYKVTKDLSWGHDVCSKFDGILDVREPDYLNQPVFNNYHSETEMLRYISQLQSKDLSLAQSMIPLGSCTMKLNPATGMAPITWPEFTEIHPFVPKDQAAGYHQLITELEHDLSEITGFAKTSLQPNSGAQGEFTGLRAIRLYLNSKNQSNRDVCLIPISAHGTNPASAHLAGMNIVTVKCQPNGELDLKDMTEKVEKYKSRLAAFMVTYPSTYGVYEPGIRKAIELVHSNGGQVYMDGANMNAQVGLTSPGDLGADVCHLNLHKTFSIPHGGGGPGVGPICVKEHLVPFLPNHVVSKVNKNGVGGVSAAPYGSALVLPISWSYVKMLGPRGLKLCSQMAMLNANYLMKLLEPHYDVVFKNSDGLCAHEFIVDLSAFKSCGVQAIDVAKRLQDYGFHGPTMSWPVPNTLMIEPTESESKYELDRFANALISIRNEIREIEEKKVAYKDGVLANAPHCVKDLLTSEWNRNYTREKAAYPSDDLKNYKFWPATSRVDDTYGDKHLITRYVN